MGSCSKVFKSVPSGATGPSASGKHGSRVRQRTRSVLVRQQQNTPGALFTAAALGQVSIVESLLANKTNPNERDGVGKTALIWAARNGHSTVVNILLKKGADIHAKDQCGKTALIWAAMNGHFDTVKVLLMRNADVRMKDTDGYTALERAVSNNQTEVMNLLRNAGLIMGSWEVWNDGPRAQAVRDPHSGQLALLQSPEDLFKPAIPHIQRESNGTLADPHAPQSTAASDNGAIRAKPYPRLPQDILTQGACGKVEKDHSVVVIDTYSVPLSKKLADLLQRFGRNKTYVAAIIFPLLTEGKVCLDVGDKLERIQIASSDVLNFAQAAQLLEDYLQIAELTQPVVVQRAPPEIADIAKTPDTIPTVTPLPEKEQSADDTKIEALPLSTAALIRAAMEGHSSTIELLVREGADVNARLSDGWTPLMLAIWNGHAMAVETLIKLGAYLEAKGGNGWTPLMVAAWNGYMEIVQTLVEHGADVNTHDVSDKTVLMWAAQKGSTDIVQFLLNHGADINIKNDKGLTARGYALREGHKDVAKLIEKAGVQELLKRSALRKGSSGNLVIPL